MFCFNLENMELEELKAAILDKAFKNADETLIHLFELGRKDFMELYYALDKAIPHVSAPQLVDIFSKTLTKAQQSPLFKKGE